MNEKTNKQQSFLHGSLILIIATVVAKIIGAVYRIPLTNLLGSRGMGFYSTAYDLYVPMYSIAMAGLPIAISRIVAEYTAKLRYKDINRTLRASQLIFVVTGGVGFALLIVLAFVLTGNSSITLFGKTLNLHTFNYGALPGILAISPSLIFCCVMSAYRGYFEGLGNMTPTGVSEILEALGKLVFGFTFATLVLKSTNNYSYAAAGALLGISLGEAFSTIFLLIRFKTCRWKDIPKALYSASPEPIEFKSQIKSIIIVAIPIVLGSLVNNVTSLIDVVMVQNQLNKAITKVPEYFATHYSTLISYETALDKSFDMVKDLSNSLYGCHRGFAFSIYNLIPVLTSTLGVSAIPVLARAWVKNDKQEIKSNIQTMIRTVAIIALPCGAGIFALSFGILSLLYPNKAAAIAIAAPNLRILGICAAFAGINAPLINMLQAIGKEKVPLKNIAVGAALKIVVNFILVGIPQINIVGVPIGTTICYAYICIANFIALVKYSKVKPDYYSMIIKPLIAAVVCGVTAYISFAILRSFISVSLATVASICLAGIAYLVMIWLIKVIEPEDILSLPMGEKLLFICKKYKIIR